MDDWEGRDLLLWRFHQTALLVALAILPSCSLNEETMHIHAVFGLILDLFRVRIVSDCRIDLQLINTEAFSSGLYLYDRVKKALDGC